MARESRRCLAISDAAPAPAGEVDRAGEHRLAGGSLQAERLAVAGRSGEAGAERVQLVVQMLARDDARGDQAGGDGGRVKERVEGSACTGGHGLAGQGDKRGAVAVVVLEAS